jgi:hypothetical protein
MNERMIFVVGTGRCGTTLVHELLARHHDVGWMSNLDDLTAPLRPSGRWNGPVYRALPPSFSKKGRVRFAPSEGYRALRLEVSPLVVEPFRDLRASDATPWLAERLRTFYGRRAEAQDTPFFLHKFAGWPRARLLHAVFPDARFVHVFRDGRAVANSLLQTSWWPGFRGSAGWPYGPLPDAPPGADSSFVGLAGLTWATLIDAFDAAAAEIPPERWLEVRYEDLVRVPREEVGRVLAFCGLDRTAAYDRELSRVTVSTGRTEAFRRDLEPDDVALLDELLGPRLLRRGYLA